MPSPEAAADSASIQASSTQASSIQASSIQAQELAADMPGAVQALLDAHPGQSAAVTLERGELSLLTRAWMTDHAARTVDVQYFIWSADNVGRLAMAALLNAADRGVQVRVLVDDFLLDMPGEMLSAMDAHPNFRIRIYNPTTNTGVGFWRRWWNLLTGFRETNQRMHNKALIVDGNLAVTGGRNLADEYYDFHHGFNFRDRDILVAGPVAGEMETAFQAFWDSPLARPVDSLLPALDSATLDSVRGEMKAYALDTLNFAPSIRSALEHIPARFPTLLGELAWGKAAFITDAPGKNAGKQGLKGGGATTKFLADMLRSARRSIVIESPYLIPDDATLALFGALGKRGVDIRICTNSLANNDNLQAISGYLKRRKAILAAGVDVFEFKPDPGIEKSLRERYAVIGEPGSARPIFVVHAKTLVIDGARVFIGTFNLDPRSMNLNTESGIYLEDARIAGEVEAAIRADMAPENSWEASKETGDSHAPFRRRVKAWLWGLLPIESLV